jgi:arylformamidase
MTRRARPLYYDVTLPIRPGMPVYPGDPDVTLEAVARVEREGYAVARLALGTHTGTHLDPPAHFIPGGATVDEAPLDLLIGRARLVRVPGVAAIDADVLAREGLVGVERVLFCTTNEHAYLEPAAARALAAGGTRLVGIDALSVDPVGGEDAPAHRELLGRGVWILERLDLAVVPPGEYDFFCLPLKIAGGDGAPARVLLRARGRCASP